jgi:hypothetical protein
LISSPLVDVPAFRKMLLAALDDRSPIGTAEVAEDGIVRAKIDGGFSMGRRAPKDDPDPPARGTTAPFRICDLYALQLATLGGAPAFNPCWPEARRDAGLVAMAEYLRNEEAR